jgi:hypothetical protein
MHVIKWKKNHVYMQLSQRSYLHVIIFVELPVKTMVFTKDNIVENRHRDALLFHWQLIRLASRFLFLYLESPN